jgi:hypothetical protein
LFPCFSLHMLKAVDAFPDLLALLLRALC